jgi:hypothetical protein
MVFDSEYGLEQVKGYASAEDSSVFKQETIDRAAVITEQFMGPGYFEARSESADVPSGQARVGNTKSFAVLNYSKSVDISKNLFDDNQHGDVEKLIRKMARNARLTRDKNAFGVIAGGFTTTFTNDGVVAFSNSHVTLSGDTIDNLETGALTDATLSTAFNSLIDQKTQDGTIGGHIPAVLLVPTVLFKTAMEVTKSVLKAGGSLNDMNYFSELYPGLQVKFSPFLGASYGGSDSAWFLLSSDHSITRWVRQSVTTDMVDYKFQRNNNYIYKAEYREVVGIISAEGLVGNSG